MTRTKIRASRIVSSSVLAITLIAASGCSASDPGATASSAKSTAATASGSTTLTRNAALANRVPKKIRDAGYITSVNSGSFPPYEIIGSDKSETGASADLMQAVGQLWGVKVKTVTADGLSSTLTGIAAGRYDFSFGPNGDFKERQAKNDFVDYVQEFVVFAVQKGNPQNIKDLDSTCGKKIAVMAGGSAEQVIRKQSTACTKAGKNAVQVMPFKDQPQSVLSVQAGRADAFFSSQAPLTYFVQQAGGKLELVGTGQSNGFDTLYQGAVVAKDSELGPLLKDTLQELFNNGTYAQVMKKWGLSANMIDKPGMNLAVS